MKKLLLLCGLSITLALTGCQSTSSGSASNDGDDIRPAFSMTVAANSIKEWPISGEIKFAYKNGNENNNADKNGTWNRYVNESTVMRFQSLGMTFVNDQSDADYLITSTLASGDDPNAKSLFTNMDPGVDTKQKGTLKIEVLDLLTHRVVWEGIIQAYSDYPVISAKSKQHAANLFVNQVTQRLPMVQ